jgi:hypothetical protein
MSMGAEWDALEALLQDHREGLQPRKLLTLFEELIDAFAGAKAATAESPGVEWTIKVLQASGIPPGSLISCESLCRHFKTGLHGECSCWFPWSEMPAACIVGSLDWRSIEDGDIGRKWFPHLRHSTPTTDGYELAREWRLAQRKFRNRRLRRPVVKKHLIESHGFAKDYQGTDKLVAAFLNWSDGRLAGPSWRRPQALLELEGTDFEIVSEHSRSTDPGVSSITVSDRAEAPVSVPLNLFDEVLSGLSEITSHGDEETSGRVDGEVQTMDEALNMPTVRGMGEAAAGLVIRPVSRQGHYLTAFHPSSLRSTLMARSEEEGLLPEPTLPAGAMNLDDDPILAPAPLRRVSMEALDVNTSRVMPLPLHSLDAIEEESDLEMEPPPATSSTFVPVRGTSLVTGRPAGNRNKEPSGSAISQKGDASTHIGPPHNHSVVAPELGGVQMRSRSSSLYEPELDIDPAGENQPSTFQGVAEHAIWNLSAQIKASLHQEMVLGNLRTNLQEACDTAVLNLQMNRMSLQQEQEEGVRRYSQQWGQSQDMLRHQDEHMYHEQGQFRDHDSGFHHHQGPGQVDQQPDLRDAG